MKRLIVITIAALFILVGLTRASHFCCNWGIHCIVPPAPDCPDCSCPCDHGLHHCSARKSENAKKYIEQLNAGDACDRIHAAKKLGCRLFADFCCCPEVLQALIHALHCDPCWEVRQAAAWSIAMQGARTHDGVLSLYIASKLDPHYMVRDRAIDALDVLLVCRRACFKDLFATADSLIKELKGKYKPGSGECLIICSQIGVACQSCSAIPATHEASSSSKISISFGTTLPEAIVIPPTK